MRRGVILAVGGMARLAAALATIERVARNIPVVIRRDRESELPVPIEYGRRRPLKDWKQREAKRARPRKKGKGSG